MAELEAHPFMPIADAVLLASGIPEQSESAANATTFAAVGLLARSRRLLSGIIVLELQGAGDCADGLTRSIFESVATGLWLLGDPAPRYELFIRAELRRLRPLVEEGDERAVNGRRDVEAMIKERWGDETREAQLPPLEQRMEPILQERYGTYRRLCGVLHPSLTSAFMSFERTAERCFVEARPPRDFDAGYLPFASILVWGLALAVNKHHAVSNPLALGVIAPWFEDYCGADRLGAWALR